MERRLLSYKRRNLYVEGAAVKHISLRLSVVVLLAAVFASALVGFVLCKAICQVPHPLVHRYVAGHANAPDHSGKRSAQVDGRSYGQSVADQHKNAHSFDKEKNSERSKQPSVGAENTKAIAKSQQQAQKEGQTQSEKASPLSGGEVCEEQYVSVDTQLHTEYAATAVAAVAAVSVAAVAYTASFARAVVQPLAVALSRVKQTVSKPFSAIFSWYFERIRREDVLRNETRRKIFEYISQNPGVHLRGIMRDLGLTPNEVYYHLGVLEKFRLIECQRLNSSVIYYPRGLGRRARKLGLARLALRSSMAKEVVRYVLDNPGSDVAEIAASLGVDKRLVDYHVNKLVRAGLLERDGDGGRELYVKNLEVLKDIGLLG